MSDDRRDLLRRLLAPAPEAAEASTANAEADVWARILDSADRALEKASGTRASCAGVSLRLNDRGRASDS